MSKQQSQILKGIAILLIVFFHIYQGIYGGAYLVAKGAGIGEWWQRIAGQLQANPLNLIWVLFGAGWIGVQIFFILSGYGLTKKYLAEPKFEVRSWLKQIWKILLPYWIALPLTHLLNWVGWNLQFAANRIDAIPYFFTWHNPETYLQSFFVPTRWLSSTLAMNFNGVLWFVGVIVQFYLLFPLLLKLMRKWQPWRFFLIALAVSLIYRGIMAYVSNGSPIGVDQTDFILFVNFPARLPEFALGMYFATRKDLHLFRNQTLAGALLIPAGILLASYRWGMIFSDFLIGLGLLLCFEFLLKLFKGVSARILDWLGEKSYYIYLYHEPLLGTLIALVFGLPL